MISSDFFDTIVNEVKIQTRELLACCPDHINFIYVRIYIFFDWHLLTGLLEHVCLQWLNYIIMWQWIDSKKLLLSYLISVMCIKNLKIPAYLNAKYNFKVLLDCFLDTLHIFSLKINIFTNVKCYLSFVFYYMLKIALLSATVTT